MTDKWVADSGEWFESALAQRVDGSMTERFGEADIEQCDVVVPLEEIPEHLRKLVPVIPERFMEAIRRELPNVTNKDLRIQCKKSTEDGKAYARKNRGQSAPLLVTGDIGRTSKSVILYGLLLDGFFVGPEADNRHNVELELCEIVG